MTIQLAFDDLVGEVGGAITGVVSRQADADGVASESRARAVRLVLRLRTEGRGNTDTSDVSNQTFDLEAHGGLSVRFSLAIPRSTPISYDGSLMRVLYEVEARVDVKLARDPKVSYAVLIVPDGGLTVYQRPHPLPRPHR